MSTIVPAALCGISALYVTNRPLLVTLLSQSPDNIHPLGLADKYYSLPTLSPYASLLAPLEDGQDQSHTNGDAESDLLEVELVGGGVNPQVHLSREARETMHDPHSFP